MIDKLVITPFQKFVRIETLSGLLLFGATFIALVWANSGLGSFYETLWQYEIGIQSAHFKLVKPLILWINDGLMALFFFVIGLEIKRELLIGELNTFKKAAFPLFAATGGMLVPVALFLTLNQTPETVNGWGIPMATDIAFTLAILKVLGKRIPLSLKIFLTAFAIIDDIGAVMVIAIFYSNNINWGLLAIGLLLLGILFFLSYKKIYARFLLFAFGIIIWYLFLKSGIHPTIAGVLLAFSVPIRQKIKSASFSRRLGQIVSNFQKEVDENIPVLTKKQIKEIDNLEDWTLNVQSPLQHLEHKLHNWVAYLIVPLFALSNAGVELNTTVEIDHQLALNIILGLFLGKIVGISAFSFLGLKLKIAELPEGINFRHVIGVASLAGVGFTMSVFIGNLAFSAQPTYIDSAKVGILAGSFISGLVGYIILRTNKK